MSRLLCGALLLFPLALQAAGPRTVPHLSRELDATALLDGNSVACFVNNIGGLANDLTQVRGKADGFYFPNDWPAHTTTALYDAGLILIGITSTGDTLAATSIYCNEFVPGEWGADPQDPQWRVYKITDDPGSWSGWPVAQGAPLSANQTDPWIADLPGV
ncbi:MAG: hypothetical protein KC488_02650, partial [Candidatus Cloacimonetes bacterium]|nr:hypothetical protein [Candidatus Cloacimonadota bacterium]